MLVALHPLNPPIPIPLSRNSSGSQKSLGGEELGEKCSGFSIVISIRGFI